MAKRGDLGKRKLRNKRRDDQEPLGFSRINIKLKTKIENYPNSVLQLHTSKCKSR